MVKVSRRLFLHKLLAFILTTLFAVFILPKHTLAAEPLISVYLTFPDVDTSRSITVHYISQEPIENPTVNFGDSPVWGLAEYPAKQKQIKGVPRWYYSAQIRGLSPNTVYYFRIPGYEQEYKFRTLPDDDSTIRIVQGGDMGTKDLIADISRDSMKAEPHVIMIGGDMAYANGEIQNYKRWDNWFSVMNEAMFTPQGFLVPLIIAIGNHEVNTLRIGSKKDRAPFYFAQFDQNDGTSYFKRRLGAHTMLFVLDTGHAEPHIGPQLFWIHRNMKKAKKYKSRIALYHIPLYPSVRNYTNPMSSAMRFAWLPAFDKYKLTMAFENHDHALKRTKLLRRNKIVEKNGTLYLGDGCWGRPNRKVDLSRPYLAYAESVKHVWYGELNAEELAFKAVGVDGVVFDQISLDRR